MKVLSVVPFRFGLRTSDMSLSDSIIRRRGGRATMLQEVSIDPVIFGTGYQVIIVDFETMWFLIMLINRSYLIDRQTLRSVSWGHVQSVAYTGVEGLGLNDHSASCKYWM